MTTETRTADTPVTTAANREALRASEEARRAAERKYESLRSLADVQRLAKLEEQARDLWPAQPERVPELRSWLAEAEALAARAPVHGDALAALRGTPLAEPEDQWRYELLSELVAGIARLVDRDGIIADVEQRIALASTIEERTVTSPEARRAWTEAAADIAQLPVYGDLELTPQLGLLPLRRDPRSGLWEFWNVASGERPEPSRDSNAKSPWIIGEHTGTVLILIPGGSFTMGAQGRNPTAAHYDPEADADESPPHAVTLPPYFIGRYPLTQGQWQRATGHNPSLLGPETNLGGRQHDLTHPVEQVSWHDCRETLARFDLELPTEAQWEYAARAGTTTPWWTGSYPGSLDGAANIADRFARAHGGSHWRTEGWLDDGYTGHSPVGTFRANGFGLHDVHGNVWEWCRDGYGKYGESARSPEDGELLAAGCKNRVYRGGSYYFPAVSARVSVRFFIKPESRLYYLGARPARCYTKSPQVA